MSAFNEFETKAMTSTEDYETVDRKDIKAFVLQSSGLFGGDCGPHESTSSQQRSDHSSQPSLSVMPVSELQEYCAKNGLKVPEYRLSRMDGNPHSPIFTIQVLLNDVVLGEGIGKSKKAAKHSAAQKGLSIIRGDVSSIPQELVNSLSNLRLKQTDFKQMDKCDSSAEQNNTNIGNTSEANGVTNGSNPQPNAISILQEICAKNGFKVPIYTELDRLGACHEPIFWFSCQVLFGSEPIDAKGSGKSKHLAKRTAAEEVLKCLQQREYPLYTTNSQKKKSKFNAHITDPDLEKQLHCKEYMNFMESLHLNTDLDTLFEAKDSDYCLRFNLIAEKLNCFVKYISLTEEQSKSSKYKCLLELKRNNPLSKRLPLFVSWGTSATSTEQAMQKAAQKAIIMVNVLKM